MGAMKWLSILLFLLAVAGIVTTSIGFDLYIPTIILILLIVMLFVSGSKWQMILVVAALLVTFSMETVINQWLALLTTMGWVVYIVVVLVAVLLVATQTRTGSGTTQTIGPSLSRW